MFAKLIIKTMNSSYYDLQQSLPFEVASRYLGAFIFQAGFNCSYYLGLAIEDPVKVGTVCTNVSFESNLTDIKFFFGPLFFSSST